jgi:alanine dehydrogenase
VGIGARVSILDVQPERLSYLHDITQGHITTFISNRMTISEEIADADLVIGAVLVPGAWTCATSGASRRSPRSTRTA